MSELLGGDDGWLGNLLWQDHFMAKLGGSGADWPLKMPVPVAILDNGRLVIHSDDGQICQDLLLSLPPCLDDPTAELPALSDATIKSMLVSGDLDAELPLEESIPDLSAKSLSQELPELLCKDMPSLDPDVSALDLLPHSPLDDDLKALVSFRCQFCSFSSADVPSLMHHSKTEHAQPEISGEQSPDSIPEIDKSMPPSPQSPTSDLVSTSDPAEEDVSPAAAAEVVEKFIYLCSECKQAFPSINDCRDHMIKDHMMTVFVDGQETEECEAEAVDSVVEPPAPAPPSTPPPTTPIKLKVKAPPKPRAYDPDFEAKPHKCPEAFCVHKFRTLGNLDLHLRCHAEDVGHRFSCTQCSAFFTKWSQCSIHLWKEHSIDVDLYTCNVCHEYKTTTRRKLECHAKIHSDERGYKCGECGKGFKQRTQLANHQVSVHSKDKSRAPKWYMEQTCEICLKTYADSKCLKKHMQAVHSKLKPFKCQICGHMSARKAMLQTHMRQHTGEKPFACELCSFRTGDHNSLRRHVMRHTGKRPYRCPHCSYSSIQSSSFKSHLQTKHPGQSGAHVCAICCFATVSSEAYRKHLSDHELNLIPQTSNETDAEMFPENMAAAQVVYRSFGASPSSLYHNVTGSRTSHDGMKQTITISIPRHDGDSVPTDDEDSEHCFLPDTGGITIPAEPDDNDTLMCFD